MESIFTEIPFDLPGRVFRSVMPYGAYDPFGQVFDLYRQNEVQSVVVLADQEEILDRTRRDLRAEYRKQGWKVIDLPMMDFGIPEEGALDRALDAIQAEMEAGRNTAVHCNAGVGRTGMFLACLASRVKKLGGADAVRWVRKSVPGAIESARQMQLVMEFGKKHAQA